MCIICLTCAYIYIYIYAHAERERERERVRIMVSTNSISVATIMMITPTIMAYDQATCPGPSRRSTRWTSTISLIHTPGKRTNYNSDAQTLSTNNTYTRQRGATRTPTSSSSAWCDNNDSNDDTSTTTYYYYYYY